MAGGQIYFPIGMPVSLFNRMEAVAPADNRMRSAFIREALERRLAEIEAEAADSSLEWERA
jgi:hypothetical protein